MNSLLLNKNYNLSFTKLELNLELVHPNRTIPVETNLKNKNKTRYLIKSR